MNIIKPITVNDAVLVSSNVPETDAEPWQVDTAYAVGDQCVANHRIYEALIEHTGIDPTGEATDPATWLDTGASNRYRMFDNTVGSQTHGDAAVDDGAIRVSLKANSVVNSVALFNSAGRAVTVRMVDSIEGVVYERTASLLDYGVSNWYDWFFADIGRRTEVALLDLPAYGTATVEVELLGSGNQPARCGHLVLGYQTELGLSCYAPEIGITDYSKKDRDTYGNPVILERAYAYRGSFDVVLDPDQVARVRRLLAQYRAQAIAWIADGNQEFSLLFGFYKDFQIVVQMPHVAQCSLTLEGLI